MAKNITAIYCSHAITVNDVQQRSFEQASRAHKMLAQNCRHRNSSSTGYVKLQGFQF